MRADFIAVVQIIISVLLIFAVLMQQRGSGTGSLLGGSSVISGGEYYRARRGLEKFLFYATIVLGSLLVITSFLYLLI
ncbi:MAG: hypothetical protein KatS3mg084_0039 [Candidatus Dojkabacteria bacterium]|jgi:protein translocase SecG subunit|nr:MAG: hypothetical protein KatS3mg084_0039 [Candidatus Dojkabacteria bacterium]